MIAYHKLYSDQEINVMLEMILRAWPRFYIYVEAIECPSGFSAFMAEPSERGPEQPRAEWALGPASALSRVSEA